VSEASQQSAKYAAELLGFSEVGCVACAMAWADHLVRCVCFVGRGVGVCVLEGDLIYV
jgi:hypothetical protein